MTDFISRFDLNPSLVDPTQSRRFESNLRVAGAIMDGRAEDFAAASKSDEFWPPEDSWLATYRPYRVRDGILVIPVKGTLLSGFGYQFGEYATGYDYIEKAMERGMADPNVKGIALDIDSPGGEVSGNFDLVDKMYAMRGQKPIKAFASDFAYSAAYSIASVADDITVSRTGGVGSIGVVTMHVDLSNAIEKAGYKITFIYAGEHKVDGNPYEALKPEVKERIQGRIDQLYSIFTSTVARNRGMDEKDVIATQALTFTASEATSNGLADAVGSLSDGLAAFAVAVKMTKGVRLMTEKNEAADNTAAITEARAAGKAEGVAEGRAEGAKAERERIAAILGSDEGKKRPKAAYSTALKTDMSAEAAASFLADLPEEKAEAASEGNKTASAFENRMNADGNPDLGQPGEREEGAEARDRKERAFALAGRNRAA